MVQQLHFLLRQKGSVDVGPVRTPERKPDNLPGGWLIGNRQFTHLPFMFFLLEHIQFPLPLFFLPPYLLQPFCLLLSNALVLLVLLPDVLRGLLPGDKIDLFFFFLLRIHLSSVILPSNKITIFHQHVFIPLMHVPTLLSQSVQLLACYFTDCLLSYKSSDYV